LGKHYSFPDSESFAVSFVNCVGNAVSVTRADVRISRFQRRDAHAGQFTQSISKSSQQAEAVNANIRDAVATNPEQHFAPHAQLVSFSSSSSSSKLFDGEYQRRGEGSRPRK